MSHKRRQQTLSSDRRDGRSGPGPEPAHPSATPRWRRLAGPAAFVVAVIAVALYLQLGVENFAGSDDAYHLGHARLYNSARPYADQAPPYVPCGPLMTHFPWTAFSVVSRYAADLWYGFHLLLIPFTFLQPWLEMKLAGAALIAAVLVIMGWSLRRLDLPNAWPWVLAVALISTTTTWRMLAIRPQMLSAAFCMLLWSLLIRGVWWQVALVSLALVFVHLNFFWAPFLVGGVFAVTDLLLRRRVQWLKYGAIVVGVVGGWLLRPNPVGAAKLLYVQTFQLMAVRLQKVPLAFGTELDPVSAERLLTRYSVVLILWLGVIAFFLLARFRRRIQLAPERRLLLWSSLTLSALFFILTVAQAQRFLDLWHPFAMAFCAAAFASLLSLRSPAANAWPDLRARIVATVCAGLLLLYGTAVVLTTLPALADEQGSPPDRTRDAGAWLRAHAQPGAIVFNVYWPDFPQLFYWNPRNRYIGGMDPIFQYAFDRRLYWKAAHFADRDNFVGTCAAPVCTPDNAEDVYRVLREDFHAAYIVLHWRSDARLYEYLQADPRFAAQYEDDQFAIVEVLPPRGE